MAVSHDGMVHRYRGTAAERAVFVPTSSAALFYETDTGRAWEWTGAAWVEQILGNVGALGDIYSVPWTDYSATSTITGWSIFTVKQLNYKRVGKLVFVQFYLRGTSNATTVTFTLPVAAVAGADFVSVNVAIRDNGTDSVNPGQISMAGGSSTVTIYRDVTGTLFTNSGEKIVWGEFWYQTA